MAVIALRPNRSASFERAIDSAGTTDAESLQTARELRSAVCLDEQVHMVGLDGEVEHAEAGGARSGQGAAQLTEHLVRSKGGEGWNRAEGDVNGMARIVFGPSQM